MKLLHVVGARPNFPKLAPVFRAAAARGIEQVVVHTGQHYDDALSGQFFRELDLPFPDENLEIGSCSHAQQTGRIMEAIEPVLARNNPDWVVVYGDVNSTVAASLTAAKLGLKIAHVEAGLRSHDRRMPEEINRLVTDRIANLLLTPSRDAGATLRLEGVSPNQIVFVGNVMVDSLLRAVRRIRSDRVSAHLPQTTPVLVTLHRPSNVDDPARMEQIMAALRAIAIDRDVVFPCHPRTKARLDANGVPLGRVQVIDPAGYLDFVRLLDRASSVVTDSGGLQEETTALGIPCFTLRENTERPITISEGTNTLVPDPSDLPGLVAEAPARSTAQAPEGWDGHAADRIVEALQSA